MASIVRTLAIMRVDERGMYLNLFARLLAAGGAV
jgi:hypothetical protein